MANVTVISRIIQRNDLRTTWATKNPILLKGEMGLETDTGKFKFGDGVTAWNSLGYSNVIPSDLGDMGYGDMTKAEYDTNGNGKVDSSEVADVAKKLQTPVTISGVSFDGSKNITISKSGVGLSNVDNTSDADKPVSTAQQIAITSVSTRVTSLEENAVILESNGKINPSLMPDLAISSVQGVDTIADMLALTNVQQGDVVVVATGSATEKGTYMFNGGTISTLANWIRISTSCEVASVNGQTGVVSLTSTNITEGTNLYYTDARVNANFATHSSSELTDGSTILHSSDSIILNGGNA